MHEGRHDRRQDDRRVGEIEELDHQEGRGAHDRRGDLTTGGRCGFDGRCKCTLVAEPDHRRDRQGTDSHRIGDRRARDHAEQCRAKNRYLGRAAGVAASNPGRTVEKELAKPDTCRKHPEQYEMEDVGRDDAERDTVNALAGQVEVIDQLRESRAGMNQNSRHGRPVQRVDHEQDGDDRQRPAHRATGRLEKDQHQHASQHDIRRRRIADPEGEVIERDEWHVHDGDDSTHRQAPIEKRDTEWSQHSRRHWLAVTAP